MLGSGEQCIKRNKIFLGLCGGEGFCSTLYTKLASRTKKKKKKKKRTYEGGKHKITITKTLKNLYTNIRQQIPTIRQPHTEYNALQSRQYHPAQSYRNLRTLYYGQNNPVVYRCNKVFKNTALACNFTIDTDTRETDDIPTTDYLNRLFQQPEGYQTHTTWADMNSLIWDSKDNLGDAFFEISTDDNYNILNGFKYIHNEAIMWSNEQDCYALIEQPDVTYEPNEIIHVYEPENRRERSPWGRCKLRIASDYVALFKNALRYNNDILSNDGLDPNLILSFDNDVNVRSAQAEMNRLQAERRKQNGRILAVRGATVQHTTHTNRDMNYLQLLGFAEDGIIRTYGVPPQLYGKIETANLGSGSGDSQKKDWKITFEGESVQIENAFNNCLKEYGFTERFHYEQMDVIDEMYDAQVAQILVQNRIKTPEEIRNELGLDKITTHTSWEDYYR